MRHVAVRTRVFLMSDTSYLHGVWIFQQETLAMFLHYFGRTPFSTYDDVAEPMIHISDDGTLGTVLVQVHVVGVADEGKDTEERIDSTWT